MKRKPKSSNRDNDEEEGIYDYDDERFIGGAEEARRREAEEQELLNVPGDGKKRRRMKATLQNGLNTPIAESNVGFQLLKKMGFQDGSGLGKDEQGIAQPINISSSKIRTNKEKQGIGIASKSKDEITARQMPYDKGIKATIANSSNRRQESGVGDTDKLIETQEYMKMSLDHLQRSYQNKMANQYRLKELQRKIRNCRSVIESLDQRMNSIEFSPKIKYWTIESIAASSSASSSLAKRGISDIKDDSMLTLDEAESLLNEMTKYLRSQHNYCLYCACAYDSQEELLQTCPGEDENDH